jgi:hypothetical protein
MTGVDTKMVLLNRHVKLKVIREISLFFFQTGKSLCPNRKVTKPAMEINFRASKHAQLEPEKNINSKNC